MTERAPATIGRYTIEAEVGRGTMGIVYRATDTVLRRAVKRRDGAGVLMPGIATG